MYKRNSKILAALLTIVLVFSIFPSLRVNADVSGTCGDNVTWTYVFSTKTLTISGTGDMANYDSGVGNLPWCDYVNSIRTVSISNGVTSIGHYAFSYCKSLTSVTIPNSVTDIGNFAFGDCKSLTSITIPDSVTDIGIGAFDYCTSLTSITIPDSVAFIGFLAFDNCTSLTTVTMNSSLAEKCKNYDVFADCPSSLKINYSDINFTYNSGGNGTVTGYVPGSDPTTVYLTLTPDTGYVVNTVTVTDSTGITTINPDSSGNYSFPLPSGDATVDATFIKGGYCGDPNVNGGKDVTWTLDDAGLLTISGTCAMADYDWSGNYSPFYQNTDIKNVIICSGITSIGDYAFDTCTSLESITIPDSVTSIGDWAFVDCTSLTGITIPDSVTSIGDSAFMGCTSLTSITIPDSVQDIDVYAFLNCTSLTDVTMSKTLYVNLVQNNKLGDVFYGITLPSIHVRYTVDYKSNGNGTISGTTTQSFGTDQIELTIQPDSNYELDKIEWSDGTNSGVLTESNGKYTMPDTEAGAVTLTATFKLDQKTVTFKNEDGTVLQSGAVDCGTNPTYTGTTPAKAEDDKYTYTFAGWSDGSKTYGPTDTLPVVTDDATYTAVFDSTVKQYTIKFVDEDGSVLQAGNFDYGTTPVYTGTTPTKSEDDDYTYTFAGWAPAVTSVTGNATYTATFTETAKPTPEPTTPTPAPTTPAPTTPAPVTVSKPGTYYLSSMVEKDGNIVITIKMSEDDTKTFDLLGTVTSDGVALTEGNQYTAAKGSAIITINKSFLDTLSAGTHKLTVTFTDGGSITIDYEVKSPAAAAPQAAAQAVQATGEAVSAASIAGACLILVAAGIVITATRKREEEA